MAKLPNEIIVTIDRWMRHSRVLRCANTKCRWNTILLNDFLDCNLKEIEIDQNGKCQKFEVDTFV